MPSAVFDVVHRMTDTLLEVTHQSRDDVMTRERLLLQQQQLLLRETNEREQRTTAKALQRDKVTLEREGEREGEGERERGRASEKEEKRIKEERERFQTRDVVSVLNVSVSRRSRYFFGTSRSRLGLEAVSYTHLTLPTIYSV